MFRDRILISSVVITVIVLCVAVTAEAGKKKGKKSRGSKASSARKMAAAKYAAYAKAIESQLPAVRRQAAAARAYLNSANEQVRSAGQRLIDANEKLARELEYLETEEKELMRAQPPDSALAESWKRYEEAREAHQQASDRALSSKSYLSAKSSIMKLPNPGPDLAELRNETLTYDSEVGKWRIRMRLAKEDFDAARRKLLDNSNQWRAAAASVQAARAEAKWAKQSLDKVLAHRLKTFTEAQQTSKTVARGEAAVAAAKAKVKSLGGKVPSKKSGGGGSKSKSKR